MPTNTYEAQRETCTVGHSALKGTCNILPHLIMSVIFQLVGFLVKGLRGLETFLSVCLLELYGRINTS